jgi:hypothetical protein
MFLGKPTGIDKEIPQTGYAGFFRRSPRQLSVIKGSSSRLRAFGLAQMLYFNR